MGGDYYDRGYVPNPAPVIFQKNSYKDLDPKNYTAGNGLVTNAVNPIVISFDVTGSMGDWTKIFYEKLPVFYGQILMNGYLVDPAISICAVGDIESDKCPLQVTQFLQGREIDGAISKLYLEGGGGANERESYELAAYFYNNFSQLSAAQLPFFFFTGDEGYYESPRSIKYNKYLNHKPAGQNVDAKQQWQRLMTTYNVFHLKKAYDEPDIQQKIKEQWVSVLGKERVIEVRDARATVDIMLGIISITNGTRKLESYIDDMEGRGQSQQRILMVKNALRDYAIAIQTKRILPVVFKTTMQKFKESYENKNIKAKGKQHQQLQKIKQVFKGELPESFYCPITGDIFLDPVMTCDGQTYERKAIEEWLTKSNTSPLTGKQLQNTTLMPNYLIKKMINEFVEKVR